MLDENAGSRAPAANARPASRDEPITRYRIEFEQRLPALDAPYASAVRAIDLDNSGASVFALLLRSGVPYRAEALDALRTMHQPNLLRVAAHGVIENSNAERWVHVVVLDEPVGGPLIARGIQAEPWTEDEIVARVLPALVKGLDALHGRGIAHRAIRPDNLFFMDAVKSSIVLGECVSAPAGSAQPAVYEPIERAMAQPAGRGSGSPECDFFALGVTLLALLLGQDPLAGVDAARILDRRLTEGSCAALMGDVRVTPIFGDLLGGLMSDTPKHRWSIERLQAWLAGRRGSPPAAEHRPLSLQPYDFLGVEYFQPRALACAFAWNWDAARRSVREARLVRWLERSVNRPDMGKAVSAALSSADLAAGRRRLNEDELVGRICVALDPEGPIRYKGFAATLDGFGPALAEALAEGSEEAVQAAAQTIASGLAVRAIESSPDGRTRLAKSLGSFVKMEAQLRDPSRGYGIERCLYELNPNLPCQSPLVAKYCAEDLDELLGGLERAAQDNNQESSPLDRHIAAFIGSRLAIRDQEKLRSLEGAGGNCALDGLAVLTTLALAQQSSGVRKLPRLTGWVADRMKHLATEYRNRGLRRQMERDLRSVAAAGSLAKLFRIATDPDRRQRDRRGFRWALGRCAAIQKEIVRLDQSTRNIWKTADFFGRRIAAGTAYTLLAVTVFSFAFRGML